MKALILVTLLLCFLACDGRHAKSQTEPSAEQHRDSRLRKIAGLPSGPNTYSLHCLTRSICWVGDFTKQWRTDDSGKHWELIYSSQRQGDEVNSLQYVDSQVGWLLTASKLSKTNDEGKTWVEQKTPLHAAGEIRSLAFVKEGMIGWAGGGVYRAATKSELAQGLPNNVYDPQTKLVLEQAVAQTKDAGRTWVPQRLPKRFGRIYGLSFVNELQGIALGDAGPLFTVDGGKHWQDVVFRRNCVAERFLSGYDMRPLEAFFLDSKDVWLTWEDGRITKSPDGGQSWCDLVLPDSVKFDHYEKYFKRILFEDTSRGLGLGANRKVYETTDGGQSWTQSLVGDFDDLLIQEKQTVWLISKAGIFELSR